MDLIFRLDIIYCYDYGASLEAELYNLSVKFSPFVSCAIPTYVLLHLSAFFHRSRIIYFGTVRRCLFGTTSSTSDPSDIISLDTTRRSSTSPIYLLAPLRYSTQLQLNLFGSSRPYSLDADLSYPYLGSVRTSCSVKLAPLGFNFYLYPDSLLAARFYTRPANLGFL